MKIARERSSLAERLLRYYRLKTTYELYPESSRDMRKASVKAIILFFRWKRDYNTRPFWDGCFLHTFLVKRGIKIEGHYCS